MPRYRMEWKEDLICMATVDAESEEEAIKKIKAGKYNADIDTEPGNGKARNIVCHGEEC